MYPVTLHKKEDKSENGIIGYLPFYPQAEIFKEYQKSFPDLLISCQEPLLSIQTQIPIKNLSFVCYNAGFSTGKKDR